MTWIEMTALEQALVDAFPPPPADDSFAALLAKIDTLTEAAPIPEPK